MFLKKKSVNKTIDINTHTYIYIEIDKASKTLFWA